MKLKQVLFIFFLSLALPAVIFPGIRACDECGLDGPHRVRCADLEDNVFDDDFDFDEMTDAIRCVEIEPPVWWLWELQKIGARFIPLYLRLHAWYASTMKWYYERVLLRSYENKNR